MKKQGGEKTAGKRKKRADTPLDFLPLMDGGNNSAGLEFVDPDPLGLFYAEPPARQSRKGKKNTKQNQLKDFFIPHAGNNHHPHLLHTKRAVGYSVFFVGLKAAAVLMASSLPLQAFMMPDVLEQQRQEILALVQAVREQAGGADFALAERLQNSAQAKSADMARNEYFSHTGSDGRGLRYWLEQAGYNFRFAGENLAVGFADAQSVVNAWVKSPLHYQNIIDSDFSETGLGLESGEYAGKESVFITQHFGSPLVALASAPADNTAASVPVVQPEAAVADNILGQKVLTPSDGLGQALAPVQTGQTDGAIQPENDIFYDQDRSQVFWKYNGQETVFTAKAYVRGPVKSAKVYIGDYAFALPRDQSEENLYQGEFSVNKPVDDFFKVVVNPSIVITGESGVRLTDSIPWFNVKIVSPTPLAKYQAAQAGMTGALTGVFSFSRAIYIVALAIFIIVLLLTIFIEIKKQHPHVIAQSLAVIGLLAVLISI